MIDLPCNIEECVCISNHKPHRSCQNNHTLEEKGQAVTFKVKNSEEVKVIVVDGCLFKGNTMSRCDGMFIFKDSKHILHSFLVELKNNPTLEKPIEQLNKTKSSSKYNDLMIKLSLRARNQKFVIVACVLNPMKLRRLEDEYKIRIINIVRTISEPYPNLREYI